MLSWVAELAKAAGVAVLIRRFTSGVSLGQITPTRTPARAAPHQTRAAWLTPANTTAIDAAQAAVTGSFCGRIATSMMTLSRVG